MTYEYCDGCFYDNPGCLKCKLGYLRSHEDSGMVRPDLCRISDETAKKLRRYS